MKRSIAALLAAVLALAAGAGSVAATPPTPASGTTWSPNQHIYYHWKAGSEPPGWMRSAVNAAAADSNASRDSKAAVLAQDDAGAAWISYTADLPNDWAVGYTVRNVPSSFSVRLRPQGYPLDWGRLRWCQFYDSPPKGCYDAEMITLHELGHVQTLSHPDDADVTTWTDTIMHWAPKTKSKAGWNAHAYGRCDVARLQIRYQPLHATTPYSTCLDLDTTLSLSASTSAARYGSDLILIARLAVDAGAAYANLAGNEIDGRSVTLQRRVPGGSWSNVGKMVSLSDGSGRYQLSTSVTATYDWRAVFSSPSDEGLGGSSSNAVRVWLVSGCSPLRLRRQAAPDYPLC